MSNDTNKGTLYYSKSGKEIKVQTEKDSQDFLYIRIYYEDHLIICTTNQKIAVQVLDNLMEI